MTKEILEKKMVIVNTQNESLFVESSSFECSLICPILKKKFELPSRGGNCSHLECFDLNAYLELNRSKSHWQCPICAKKASFDELYVDSCFVDILSKSNQNDLAIVFNSDLEWNFKKESSFQFNKNQKVIEIIELI